MIKHVEYRLKDVLADMTPDDLIKYQDCCQVEIDRRLTKLEQEVENASSRLAYLMASLERAKEVWGRK